MTSVKTETDVRKVSNTANCREESGEENRGKGTRGEEGAVK